MDSLDNPTAKLLLFASRLQPYERGVMKDMILDGNERLAAALAAFEAGGPSADFKNEALLAVIEHAVDSAYARWNALFEGFSTDHGKEIAREAQQALGEQGGALTYGEIDFFSFATVLEKVNPREGEVFVDLGHGTGRAVVAAALLHGHHFAKCWGIELVEGLQQASADVQQRYEAWVAETQPLALAPRPEVDMVLGDMFEDRRWLDADVVFANSTCFTNEMMLRIAAELVHLKPGTRVVTLTKNLESEHLELIERKQYAMSWGPATVYTSVRR